MFRSGWFFLFLLFASCSTSSNESANRPAKEPAHSLRISFNTTPSTLDPRKSGDFVSSTLISLLYEGLSRCLPDGSAEPAIAQTVSISKDKKTYTFHLRPAFWSDGSPLTAYDFEASWKKILDPSFSAVCASLLYPIKNAEKCAKGEIPLSEAGIRALDAATFQVELERPTPYFFSLTAFPLFFPVPLDKNPSHLDGKELICSGPYKIETCVLNSEWVLKKNSRYWNPQISDFDAVHISIIGDENTALELFEQGQLDWLGGPFSPLPPDALETLSQNRPLQFLPSAASTFCTFNTQTFPFENKNLRKAFSLAIDRKELVEQVLPPGQLPAYRCFPPTLFGDRDKKHYSFDPGQAQEHLLQAIEEMGLSKNELSHLTLYYKPLKTDERLAQALQKQWRETLGITVQLQSLDFKTHIQTLQGRNYQIALASWIAQFSDPINLLDRFKEKRNPKNYPGWEDSHFVDLLERAALALKPEERMNLLERAESFFADQTAISPLFHWNSPYLKSDRIREIATSPGGGILLERFQKQRSE